ncbi:MAG: hypothetical protein JWQ01_4972 [Massilia sp.]|nr:hypothetical protein [Massilia sp.]
MKRMKWRGLALGLITSTLGLGIAACDDDTSSTSPDLSTAGGDMSGAVDDMATGTPGTGQIVLADVVGTVFSPSAPGGQIPRTHSLVAIASFPKTLPPSDPSSNLDLVTQMGCTINRFTATNPPHGDGDAGNITITGFNTISLATNTKTGSTQRTPNPPITCMRVAPLMTYTCFFSGTAGSDGGAMGTKTDDVIFPIVPHQVTLNNAMHTPTGTVLPNWPAAFGEGTCSKRYLFNPMDPAAGTANCMNQLNMSGCVTQIEACEQEPILPLGVAQITETVAGGTDYMAASKMLGNTGGLDGGGGQFPGPIYPVSVKSGTTEIIGTDIITGGTSLSMADGTIDPTKTLTITFSCDPNDAGTPGAKCSGTADIAALLIKTSTGTKAAFGTSTASGVSQCIARVTTGQIKIDANQLTALLGGQTGGSLQLALARVSLQPAVVGSHTLAFTAGMGVFGFTNQ